MPDWPIDFGIAMNSLVVLDAHLKKHEAKCRKHNDRKQKIQKTDRQKLLVGDDSKSCHIHPGNQPDNPGNQQQCAPVNMKNRSLEFGFSHGSSPSFEAKRAGPEVRFRPADDQFLQIRKSWHLLPMKEQCPSPGKCRERPS